MKLEGQLNNEIKSLNDSIKTQERAVKGFQDQIESIQKQIFYWKELERLQKLFTTETDPNKKADITKQQREVIDKIKDRSKNTIVLKTEISAIQDKLNNEKILLDSLKQEKKGREGEKNALPYSVARGNVKKAAILAGAIAVSTLMYNYFGKDKAPKYTEKNNIEDNRESNLLEHKKTGKESTAHHNDGLPNKKSHAKAIPPKVENLHPENKPEEKKEEAKTQEKDIFIYKDSATGHILLKTSDKEYAAEFLKGKSNVVLEETYKNQN